MKNFSELLASSPRLQVSVRVMAITDNGLPRATILVNGERLYDNVLESMWAGSTTVDLLEPLTVEVIMSNKQHDQHRETAIIVQDITVDQCQVIPRFGHMVQYAHEQGVGPATSYLGFNGCWRLSTQRPFYQWWHDVTGQGWLLMPSQDHSNTRG